MAHMVSLAIRDDARRTKTFFDISFVLHEVVDILYGNNLMEQY